MPPETTEVLDTLQKTVETTGSAIKSIGDRLDKADKSIGLQEDKFKQFAEEIKAATDRLVAIQKSLDEHVETTRKALKEIPAGVHSGGHAIAPRPLNTRADGSGFQWSDERACKAFGLFLMAGCAPREEVRTMALKSLEAEGKRDPLFAAAFKAAGSTSDFANAGALVPDGFIADIIRNIELAGHFQANCGRIPMTAPSMTIPKNLTELTVYYPDENQTIPESDPSVGDITFVARMYATMTKWSNTLDEDSAISFGAFISELVRDAHALAIDRNGFLGDGTSAYGRTVGIKNASGVLTHILGNAIGSSATNTGKDTFGELAYGDLVAAQSLLPTNARAGAKWYCHRYVAGTMRSLVDTNGRPIFNTDYVNGKRVTTILGDPLVEVDVLPSVSAATTKFIGYGDLKRAMAYGERRSLRVDNSREAGFANDQTWVRSTARRAIGPLEANQFIWLVTSTT